MSPRKTRALKLSVDANAPRSRSTDPVMGPLTWFTTHVEAPPAESGSGAPKKNAHTPLGHCASRLQAIEVSSTHRCESRSPRFAFAFGSGPPSAQVPHGCASRSHVTENASLPSPITVAL